MTSKWFASLILAVAFSGGTLLNAAPALATDDVAPSGNGPDVARVSIVQGSVVVQRGDSKTQVAASINAPLLPGDYLSTGPKARAEVQFDGYTMVRLGGGVQARITTNDANSRQLQLADGTIEVAILHDDGPIEIDTPSVTVQAQNEGAYRITIGSDGSTWVTARRGEVSVATPQHTYDVQSGKTLVARGSASSPSVAYTAEVGYDSFDQFNSDRDRVQLAALADDQNLNPSVAGYDNLDAYGQWQDVSGYGQAWVPNEPAGWAPYRDGSWTWADGYGWTWVASEPWGWVPYHYGRWFYASPYGWCWYPPAVAVAPVWQPALVGFFGFGGGVGFGLGFGFGFGGIGWVPLAPFAPFYPWYPGWAWGRGGWGWNHGYGGWGTHVTNITNVRNVYNHYPNAYHGGASGTLTGNFHNGNFTHVTALDPHQLSHVGTIRGALPLTPTASNLRYSGKTLSHPVTLSKAFSDPRFASNPSLAQRTPFSEQQKAVAQAIHGNPAMRANAPVAAHENAPVTRANAPVAAHENAPVAAHENAPITRANAPETMHENASDPWQRFNAIRGTGSEIQSHPAQRTPESGFSRAPQSYQGSRGSQAPSGSWSRFSHERGNVTVPSSAYGGRGGYSGGSYRSYSRGSYPSYSRGSYPSYSRGSYPSYSRGSYPSYSRGSAPSYSRGSAPSYSHSSGGGGGGGSRGGGGRPPRG